VSLELPAASALPTVEPSAPVALTRTASGWAVVHPGGADVVGDVVEGMCLADLVTQELGGAIDPDRSARRSARGTQAGSAAEDPREARLAELERTVAQLEHALAARVSTERAIGVLAERHGTSPRDAFEQLRQSARSQGRAVADLAGEVLDTLTQRRPAPAATAADPSGDAPACPSPRPPATVDGSARLHATAEPSS
jgi:ANTAR domain